TRMLDPWPRDLVWARRGRFIDCHSGPSFVACVCSRMVALFICGLPLKMGGVSTIRQPRAAPPASKRYLQLADFVWRVPAGRHCVVKPTRTTHAPLDIVVNDCAAVVRIL